MRIRARWALLVGLALAGVHCGDSGTEPKYPAIDCSFEFWDYGKPVYPVCECSEGSVINITSTFDPQTRRLKEKRLTNDCGTVIIDGFTFDEYANVTGFKFRSECPSQGEFSGSVSLTKGVVINGQKCQ